jgi:hypothetical protein
MNPVEITTGKSFKGLAAYLLHDAGRAATTERVGWAQSFNLDGASPDMAWRLMAATAMSADQLKEAAGIRKSKAAKNVAYHFALTFNPKDEPSEEMQRAAVSSALEAFGLGKYQAFAVMHDDTPHKHIHVVVNLIDPETGISAASKQPGGKAAVLSNMQRKMSRWASQFERDNGLVVTEGRLENANKRAQGEQVDAKRKPRAVIEQEKTETTDRRDDFKKRVHDKNASELTRRGHDMSEAHKIEWDGLKLSYRSVKQAIDEDAKKDVAARIEAIKADNKNRWAALFMRQRSEKQDFDRGEKSAIGRIWHAAAVMRDRAIDGDILGGFVAAFSRAERRAIVERKHQREQQYLSQQIRKQIGLQIRAANREQGMTKDDARLRFLKDCAALKKQQDQERGELRRAWQMHNQTRKAALAKVQMRGQGQSQGQGMGRGRGLEPN